jgi:hypothetical protein
MHAVPAFNLVAPASTLVDAGLYVKLPGHLADEQCIGLSGLAAGIQP